MKQFRLDGSIEYRLIMYWNSLCFWRLGRYVNMNGPTAAEVTSPDYIQPWSTMDDSSSEDED
jgi:hypothetical protein